MILDEQSSEQDFSRTIYDVFGTYEPVQPEDKPALLKLLTTGKGENRRMRPVSESWKLCDMRVNRVLDLRENWMRRFRS